MKKFGKALFASLLLSSALFVGCKKDDNSNPGTGGGPYKVKFVGTLSAGSNISSVVITYGVSNKSYTGLSGTSWTKELDLTENDLRSFSTNPTKNISFGVQGIGKDATSTGKVEIFVNSSSVKTGEANGTALSPSATYIFN